MTEKILEDERECQRCGTKVDGELHACPYNEDVNSDDTPICNCCPACAYNCAQDV